MLGRVGRSRAMQEVITRAELVAQTKSTVLITGETGTGKEVVALCRCGATKNRPFCDGAHKAIGFTACEKATPPVA